MLPLMLERGVGSIVDTSSGAGPTMSATISACSNRSPISPSSIGTTSTFLASTEARHLIGQTLDPDAGVCFESSPSLLGRGEGPTPSPSPQGGV